MERELMTVREVLQYLKIGRTTLWKLRIQGRLPEVRIGCRLLFRRSDVEQFVKKCVVLQGSETA